MYGFGHGSRFVAHLGVMKCQNCGNENRAQLYAGYTSTMLLGATDFEYQSASVVCPICHVGSTFQFPSPASRAGKLLGGSKRRSELDAALAKLNQLAQQAHIPSTQTHFESLGWIEKRRYRTMLQQLCLNELLIQLEHGAHTR